MKKFLTLLNILLFGTLVILSLYIFDIIEIPFLSSEQVVEEPLDPTNIPDDPIDPADKVTRKKSYDELMKKGNVYYEQELYSFAIDAYTKANKENPTKIEPLLSIVEIQLIENNFEQAEKLSLEILKINQHSVKAKINLGKAYIGLEEFARAKSTFDGIVSDDETTRYYQGVMALYFTEYERARKLLNTLSIENASRFVAAMDEFDIFDAGEDAHLKILVARAFVQSDEPTMAKELVWDVLKETRDYRDAWIILGYSYLKLKSYEESIDALEEALRQDPEKPETMFYLGLAYAGNDQLDEAIEILELAQKNGYEPVIHVEQKLAELYFQVEDYDKASEKYEEVISMNATNLDYFIRPVWIYIDKINQPEKATRLAEKALLNHPDDAMAYNLLGWSYAANNDFINAKKNLEKSLELQETFDAPYLNLGWMYERQGNIEKAKDLYKKAFEFGQESPVGNLAAQRYNALLEKELNQSFMANVF